MNSHLAPAAAVVALLAAAGCDVGKTARQTAARRVMAATLIATPALALRPEFLAEFDGGLPDAGLTLDAGLPFSLDGGVTVPAQTRAFAFFGERQGDGLDQPPVGLANATMKIETGSGGSFALAAGQNGTFGLSSLDDPAFGYAEGERYTFTATFGGEAYLAQVDAVPAQERVRQFHPDAGVVVLDANGADGFTFTRADPPQGKDRDPGFVTVVPISRAGEQGQPTWTNVPTDAFGLLKLVAAPRDFKRTEVTVPGTAFPAPGQNYLVILQTAKVGTAQSDNLFLGSAILAGTSDVAIVKTR